MTTDVYHGLNVLYNWHERGSSIIFLGQGSRVYDGALLGYLLGVSLTFWIQKGSATTWKVTTLSEACDASVVYLVSAQCV